MEIVCARSHVAVLSLSPVSIKSNRQSPLSNYIRLILVLAGNFVLFKKVVIMMCRNRLKLDLDTRARWCGIKNPSALLYNTRLLQ